MSGRGEGGDGCHLAAFLFASAERHPDKVCVEEGDEHFTFAELAELAARLRDGLREALGPGEDRPSAEPQPPAHGRRPSEEIINVVLPRGALCIAAVHAVMLQGKAYNVFDLGNPREVLVAQLEIARPRVVISSEEVAELFDLRPLLPQGTVLLDAEQVLQTRPRSLSRPLRPLDDADLASAADRLAYVIFTSGSTGKPKAVMIEHGSACNQVRVFGEAYGLEHGDRVCQSISMAFDPHVNEVFGSLRWGCTLVVMSDVVKRSGPDVLPWIVEERVSVLTMTPSGYRMMMSSDVDVSRQGLPELRVCGAGGEALTREVLDSWAVGRKFFNLYGPTETTVTSVMAELKPQEPIVIGRSLPSYWNAVLDPSTRARVERGEHGVLFTGGPGVARGYLNDEAKTQERFVDVPGIGRAYNTGDIVSQDDAGNFHWIGRADFQAKVRGNRIELEYLEHAISDVHGVEHCEARVVDSGERLVLLASGTGFDEAMLREVASKLGRAYELSAVKIVDSAAWSFSVNGKLLRNTVPLEDDAAAEDMQPQRSVVDELSSRDLSSLGTAAIAVELARALGVALQTPEDDFFSSGGTSVTAATLVSKLRQLGKRDECLQRLRNAAVRDIYECRTMARLAELLDGAGPCAHGGRLLLAKTKSTLPETDDGGPEVLGTERFYLVGFLQIMWIVMEQATLFIALVRILFWVHSFGLPSYYNYVLAVIITFGLLPFTILLQSIFIKFLRMISGFRPGQHCRIRLWSLHYFRWWVLHHMQDMVPTILIAGTPFAALWAWFMGAKVGKGVVLWTVPKNAELDLLELGDGVTVGPESYFNTTHAERGVLILGPIKVGAGAKIGCRVNVAQNATVEAGAVVEDLTHVSGRFRAPAADVETGGDSAGEQEAGPAQESVAPFRWWMGLAMLPGMGIILSLYTFVLPIFAVGQIFGGSIAKLISMMSPSAGFWVGLLIQVVAVQLVALVAVIVLKWMLVGRLGPGKFAINSLKYWRFWFLQNLVNYTSAWLPLTLMTVYYPILLRFLGARVGSKAEFGAFTFGYVPDLLKLGDGVFFADRCGVGCVEIDKGVCELKRTTIADHTFVGNGAVVKAGSTIQEDVLVGVMSLAPSDAAVGTSWLGVPPIQLPDRKVVTSKSKEYFSYSPTILVFVGRLVFDFLRGQVPSLVVFLFFFLFNLGPELLMTSVAYAQTPGLEGYIDKTAETYHVGRFWIWLRTMQPYTEKLPHTPGFWIAAGLWGVACMCVTVLAIVLLKWLANCRLRPGSHMLYSFRVAMCGFNLALQTVAYPLIQTMLGTPLMSLYLRLLGARIGKRAFIHTIMIAEPDLLSLGDDVCLNRMALMGTHTFEDRVMKLDRIVLEDSTAVGCESAVLRGAALRQRAVLEGSTLCMVDEELLRGRHRGCPSSRCA